MSNRRVATILTLAVALQAAAGCTDMLDGDAQPPLPPLNPPIPNFLGDWSLAEGNFSLVQVHNNITRFNAATGNPDPYPSSCTVPFTYELDLANRNITVASHRALHPLDPGPLRVLLLTEFSTAEKCTLRGPHGINEGAPPTPACASTLPPSQQNETVPWRCNLPFDLQEVRQYFYLNLTVWLDAAEPGGYRLDINGNPFGGNQSAAFHTTLEGGSFQHRYEVETEVRAHGSWPYSAVRR